MRKDLESRRAYDREKKRQQRADPVIKAQLDEQRRARFARMKDNINAKRRARYAITHARPRPAPKPEPEPKPKRASKPKPPKQLRAKRDVARLNITTPPPEQRARREIDLAAVMAAMRGSAA